MRIGSDPEYPVYEAGVLTMAIGKVGGSKKQPMPISMGHVQEDGVMVEINPPPADDEDAFVANTLGTYAALQEHLMTKGLSCSPLSCVHFTKEELMAAPAAMKFGCEPEVDAYTGHRFDAPSPYTTLRSAGGHIHIDDNIARSSPMSFAQALDLYLGLPSLLMDTAGQERRALYGRAGSFRYKTYGIEYRVLSNFWTASEEHIRWVWQAVQAARQHVIDMRQIPPTLQDIITTADVEAAHALMDEVWIPVGPMQETGT